MKRFAPLIAAVVGAIAGNAEASQALEQWLQALEQSGGENANLAQAIQHMRNGERDPDTLCQNLGPTGSMIIETTLQALDNPAFLQNLLTKDA